MKKICKCGISFFTVQTVMFKYFFCSVVLKLQVDQANFPRPGLTRFFDESDEIDAVWFESSCCDLTRFFVDNCVSVSRTAVARDNFSCKSRTVWA